MSEMIQKVGVWAFMAGVVIAMLVGLISGFSNISPGTMGLISGFMVLLGLIVGALNVTDDEVNSFIIAAIGLTVGSAALAGLGTLLAASTITAVMGSIIQITFTIFGVFVAAAVFIPALKAVYKISKD